MQNLGLISMGFIHNIDDAAMTAAYDKCGDGVFGDEQILLMGKIVLAIAVIQSLVSGRGAFVASWHSQ